MKAEANPLKRKVHKEQLRLNAVAAELNRKHPEPMSLFHKREKQGEIPSQMPTRKPEVTNGIAGKAADVMAAWDNSDPFAYGRTFLHVKQGFLSGEDVVKEMSQRTLARKAARIKEVDNAKAH